MCAGCKTPTRRGRKRALVIGAALVLGPVLLYLLWIVVLGVDFIEKKARDLGFDERLIYMESCFGCIILEIVALWFLNRTVRWPIDLLSIGAGLLAILSILLALFMFVIIVGIAMGGAG